MSIKESENINKKLKVAYSSLIGALVIVSIKLVATYLSGSLAVLSELFHSSTDLIASLVTVTSIKFASKPPDEDHHYGHDKIESFSALFQVLILVMMCAYVLYEAYERIIHPPTHVKIDVFTFLAISICIVIDYSRAKALKKVALETKSQALEADALHFSSDILSSVVVLAGIGLYYVHPIFDPIAASIVSFIIIMITIDLSKRSIDSLLDKTPKGLRNKIENEIKNVKEVEGIKSLRMRSSGAKIFIDMTINVARTKMFQETHNIVNTVESKIQNLIPNADIVVHSEPVITEKETINDKIKIIVNSEGYKCHDVVSHLINNEIFSELHVEIDNTNNLIEAHDEITKLEKKLQDEIGIITHIKIHIDEPSDIIFDSNDITTESENIIYELNKLLKKEKHIRNYHDIKIVQTKDKIRISLNMEFDENYELDKVHDIVSTMEGKLLFGLRHKFPNLNNVIIHAEPIGHN